MKRAVLIVLDSVGVGNAHDAKLYGDEGANTLTHILEDTNTTLHNLKSCKSYGEAEEISAGKGTIEGHWEIAGIETKQAFETFPNGFPKEMIDLITEETGLTFLGNCSASGTKIIKDLGEEHMKTGKPIIYTSADSVFQIAAHEETFGLENLYNLCETVRKILNTKWNISRVIARPFIGTNAENFKRTSNRHDYSVEPPKNNLLNILNNANVNVIGVGKIKDIFCGQGISTSYKTKDNTEGIKKTIELMKTNNTENEFIFTNLVDFDMLYGHRRDVKGYRDALVEFDNALPEIINLLKDDDILIITADHGCDPTYKGTDHTRENIPIWVFGKNANKNFGKRNTFADIGQTLTEYFETDKLIIGTSFLREMNREREEVFEYEK